MNNKVTNVNFNKTIEAKWTGWPIPKNTQIGNICIDQIIVFVDFPLLFICNNGTTSFIATCIEDDEVRHEFLYSSISQENIRLLLSGSLDLHDAFLGTERQNFIVSAYVDDRYSCIEISSDSVLEDWLPFSGEFLTPVSV